MNLKNNFLLRKKILIGKNSKWDKLNFLKLGKRKKEKEKFGWFIIFFFEILFGVLSRSFLLM